MQNSRIRRGRTQGIWHKELGKFRAENLRIWELKGGNSMILARRAQETWDGERRNLETQRRELSDSVQ